uniref:Uncharacterized protein n=1 Tax=Lepeophtheirus salmonis TaxID=72036 RepID=A0A0K2TKD1_LEPSM
MVSRIVRPTRNLGLHILSLQELWAILLYVPSPFQWLLTSMGIPEHLINVGWDVSYASKLDDGVPTS